MNGMETCPFAPPGDTTYSSFLRIPHLLELQNSGVVHDQLLFVVIHQSHELWFKLLLHELDLAVDLIERRMFREAAAPLRRIVRIIETLIAQWDVLDTMTPRGYLGFRGELESGSGFQSAQFREIEFTAGLPDPDYVVAPWLADDERRRLHDRLDRTTLRMAFLDAVEEAGQSVVELLADPADPLLGGLAEQLIDFDEAFAQWRARHALAVERQIGAKPGTGSSSGVGYLRATTSKRFFPELWDARSVL